jgi:hypothetical protein
MIPLKAMKRSHWIGIYGFLWLAVLWLLFLAPNWAPGGASRGTSMAWFVLQKGPAVLLLYLLTDFLLLYRKEKTIPFARVPDYLRERWMAAALFLLGIALFVLVNLL